MAKDFYKPAQLNLVKGFENLSMYTSDNILFKVAVQYPLPIDQLFEVEAIMSRFSVNCSRQDHIVKYAGRITALILTKEHAEELYAQLSGVVAPPFDENLYGMR
jgi:hypothetical protein